MTKCPKCGKEIDHLRDFSPAWQEFKATIGKDGYMSFEPMENYAPMDRPDDYECPECNTVLFTDQVEAENFLKGEDEEGEGDELLSEV